jgi:hypothetical protein
MTATIAARVAEALQAAGYARAVRDAGFFALESDGQVIVVADLGEHAEGHWDSIGQREREAGEVRRYAAALEAAGWAVQVSVRGGCTGLVVTGRAEMARTA